MATPNLAAARLRGTGALALEMECVGRAFGALVVPADVTLRVGAGERRAILGSSGAGKTRLFNAVTGIFRPPPAASASSARTSRRCRCRSASGRGCAGPTRSATFRWAHGAGEHLPCGARRLAGALLAAAGGARDPTVARAEAIAHAVHLDPICTRRVASLSQGQRRQLEILTVLPVRFGCIIIEHDLDMALGVSERVTMMHNGRIFREGTPEEIEADPEVQRLCRGGGHG